MKKLGRLVLSSLALIATLALTAPTAEAWCESQPFLAGGELECARACPGNGCYYSYFDWETSICYCS